MTETHFDQNLISETHCISNRYGSQKVLKKMHCRRRKMCCRFPDMLTSEEYSNYIKDPFNMEITRALLLKNHHMRHILDTEQVDDISHPMELAFKSLTEDVGVFDGKMRKIDVQTFQRLYYCTKNCLHTFR
jgi:hypothetical protein